MRQGDGPTPYRYAVEALADGRGILAEFRNAASLATGIDHVLGMPELRRHRKVHAAAFGQQMSWSQVAARYQELFATVLGGPPAAPAGSAPGP